MTHRDLETEYRELSERFKRVSVDCSYLDKPDDPQVTTPFTPEEKMRGLANVSALKLHEIVERGHIGDFDFYKEVALRIELLLQAFNSGKFE